MTSPLASARRVVIKVGSSLLIDQDSGLPHTARFAAIAADAAKLRAAAIGSSAVPMARGISNMRIAFVRLCSAL